MRGAPEGGDTSLTAPDHLNGYEFGFGGTTTVDTLIVRWPSGAVSTLTNVATNQTPWPRTGLRLSRSPGLLRIMRSAFR
ncbi:MAG: hypothetical protein EXS64_18670 [Candidatus Latescibacteria bacterium]|nr:hypothetical protein [Candidatus Latescibacterota bacterium]